MLKKKRYPAQYGATIFFKEGDTINVGDKILEWDPFAMPVLGEVKGKVKFEDMIVGSTIKEEVDAVTGLSQKLLLKLKIKKMLLSNQELLLLMKLVTQFKCSRNKETSGLSIPVGANITVNEGDED